MLTPAAKLAEADLQCTLAVSIHAGNQALRESLVPRCPPGPSLLSPFGSAEMPLEPAYWQHIFEQIGF